MSKTGDDQFEVRLGRIRSASGHKCVQGFFKQVGRSARTTGHGMRRSGGRHQRQSATSFHRRVIVKVSIVRMHGKGVAAQRLHLTYIQRDSAVREDEHGGLYDRGSDNVHAKAFEEHGADDRHQFRIIVSPEDALEMADLKAFTRDLMREMETDLGTKLNWVAADHYDTGQPHTHIVIRGKRDDGRDLVMPKRYVAHGIRTRAQELVSLELGPVSELEGRQRMMRMADQERFTELDRGLMHRAEEHVVDLSEAPRHGQVWRRQLEKQRLKTLTSLALAEPLGKGRWRIDPQAEATLRQMGERGDIIKAMHRAMKETGEQRLAHGASIFDSGTEATRAVTGKVIARGIADDVFDRAYIVIDGMGGHVTYVNIGPSDRLADFDKGMIVTAQPASWEPRVSDKTIDEIASANGGRYSPRLHMGHDASARPQFVEAHVRRLEALRRAGHATRHNDGAWSLPPDYLARAGDYERQSATSRPVKIEIGSRLTLSQMTTAMGATWLDTDLRDRSDNDAATGFGAEVEQARQARRKFLTRQGIIRDGAKRLSEPALDTLRTHDLEEAGSVLSRTLGKPFASAPTSGRISGIYTQAIDRPSGRFAVIERAKDFTLVPWREVMDRNLGKSISGIARGQSINWTLTRGR